VAQRMGKWDNSPVWIVSDIDSTLYTNPEYIRLCSIREVTEIARILGISTEKAEQKIMRMRKKLSLRIPREITLTETVYALGLTEDEWGELRCRAWEPEKWIKYDAELCAALEEFRILPNVLGICFATNSPIEIGRRNLYALGIPCESNLLFGPENLECSKPDARFFPRIAASLGVSTTQCVSIGDRGMSDADPAIVAGFCCAFIVEGRNDFICTLRKLTRNIKRGKYHDDCV